MLLFEIFNQPVKWKYTYGSPTAIEADFQVNGKSYTVWANQIDDSQYDDIWVVEFALVPTGGFNRYEITNTGDEYIVFSTVIDIIKDIEDKYQMRAFSFLAKEPSRMKLYQRLVKRYFPSWKMNIVGNSILVTNQR